MKKFLAALSAVIMIAAAPLPANASNFSTAGWQTGFSVTTTSSGFDNSGNYVITVTWDHTAALFSTSAASAGTLWAQGQRVLQCDTETVTYTYNVIDTPSGCSSLTSTRVISVSGNGEVLTVTYTISAANYAGKTKAFLVPDVWFTDQNGDDLIVPVGGVGSGSTETPAVYFGGPLITGFDIRTVKAGEVALITLTGKRMTKITSASVDGVAIEIVSQSRGSLVLRVPALSVGTYTLNFGSSNGSIALMKFLKVS